MTEEISETKKELRAVVFARRTALSEHDVAVSDEAIARKVLDLELFKTAQLIFCYAGTPGEVATDAIIAEALIQGKRVCLPRCLKLGIMHAYEIQSLDDLVEGMYGIREPGEHCPLIDPAELDLALVPCVSCTEEGARLGYGGGFYDRYLADRAFAAVVLCRDALMLEDIPVDEYDLLMDYVITDSRVVLSRANGHFVVF